MSTSVPSHCSNFKKSPHLLQFVGNCCTLRRADGAIITARYVCVCDWYVNSG